MKLVSVDKMLALEQEANRSGLSYPQMMENAGRGLADFIDRRFSDLKEKSVLGLIGSGNNGGDTLIALQHLASRGWRIHAYIVKNRSKSDPLAELVSHAGGKVINASEDEKFNILKNWINECHVILDGILGTGFKLPLKNEIADILRIVSKMQSSTPIVAVDCPSGVDCRTGEAAPECLKADFTVCMAAVKDGLLKFPAMGLCGEIVSVDIGLPESLKAWEGVKGRVINEEDIKKLLPERPPDSHKGTFGTCVIIAGSTNYCGAALLSAESAYRSGAGLVRLAVPGAIYEGIVGSLPEATWLLLPHSLGVINEDAAAVLLPHIAGTRAMLLGPGWGQETETLEFLKKILVGKPIETRKKRAIGFSELSTSPEAQYECLPPTVIDADALKLLTKIENWENKIPSRSVLTPHPGEMSVLTKTPVPEIQKNRIAVACEYAKKWNHIIVLKGAGTIVAEPGGEYSVIPIATAALAKAGSGDVLSGMITGLLAQGIDAYDAAVCAAWLHAKAGVEAAHRLGNTFSVNARDVIDSLSDVFKTISGKN